MDGEKGSVEIRFTREVWQRITRVQAEEVWCVQGRGQDMKGEAGEGRIGVEMREGFEVWQISNTRAYGEMIVSERLRISEREGKESIPRYRLRK